MPKILVNAKETILSTAREMLIEDGYEKLNIRDIASACKIGMGTIYNYFKSKDEIVRHIFMNEWQVVLKDIDNVVLKNADELDKLEEIYKLIRKFVSMFHSVWMDMYMNFGQKYDLNNIQVRKTSIREQINIRVRTILEKSLAGREDDLDFIYDFISRNLIAYCMERDFDYKKLEGLLAKVIGM